MKAQAASSKKHRDHSVKVRTGVKAGALDDNHNPAVKVRTGIKAGGGDNWSG